MDKLNSILSVCRSFLQHKPRAEQEKEQSSRESIIVDDVCPDVSIDIFLVTEQIEWKVLTPIMYMNIVQDAFQEAFRDPNNDPWSMAQASTWGAFQDPEGRVFKAVLKQTGQAIGFGSFNFVNLTLAQRKLDVRRSWLVEKKGTEGELLRWWFQEIDNLIDQTLGEKNPVCKSNSL
jgi:hypothetical protein